SIIGFSPIIAVNLSLYGLYTFYIHVSSESRSWICAWKDSCSSIVSRLRLQTYGPLIRCSFYYMKLLLRMLSEPEKFNYKGWTQAGLVILSSYLYVRWSSMLEVLTLLLNLLGWICFMSLCARHNDMKSEGRGMPISVSATPDNYYKKSETVSTSLSYTNENARPFKRSLTWQKRRFGRDETEKKSEERKMSNEKTEPKSSKKDKKEIKEKDVVKGVNKVTKEEIKVAKVDEKFKKPKEEANKTDHVIEKTQIIELKPAASGTAVDEAKTQMEISKPGSSRSIDINDKVAAVPGETLALLAAAEQMAMNDKGDYDNFGPPEAKVEK
ncbi:unnamed protein product, partial [Cylicocyclus nassatus]